LEELRLPSGRTGGRGALTDARTAFAAWLKLKDAFLDRLENSRISVYGFDTSHQKRCRPTRDVRDTSAALRGAEKRSHGEAIALGQPSGAQGAKHEYQLMRISSTVRIMGSAFQCGDGDRGW
jgi:hypothetical protein